MPKSRRLRVTLAPASADDLAAPTDRLDRGLALGFAPEADALTKLGAVLGVLTATPRPPLWGTYWAVARVGRRPTVVGVCGFKGAPDAEGAVEIGYMTLPRFEGRGVATRVAEAMLRLADGAAASVLAHTLPTFSASAAVLSRLGFKQEGAVIDPEDGEVWRWRRAP